MKALDIQADPFDPIEGAIEAVKCANDVLVVSNQAVTPGLSST
jgi:hypothetical protein